MSLDEQQLAAQIKAALSPEAADLGPPAGGMASAMLTGAARRRARWIRIVAAVVAVLAVAAIGAALVLTNEDGGDAGPQAAADDRNGTPPAVVGLDPAPSTTSSTTSTSTSTPTTASSGVGVLGAGAASGPTDGAGSTAPAPPSPPPTTPSTTSTTLPPPGPGLELLVSPNPDRSTSIPLDDATVSGIVHVFYDHMTFPLSGPNVTFWLDDPTGSGAPHRVESSVAYDFEATAMDSRALGFDTSTLSDGPHSIAASAGPGHLFVASFVIDN